MDKIYIFAGMKKLLDYLWPVALCLATGFVASLFQKTALTEWYPTLEKSSLTPPAIVFPIVWSVLYVLMGVALGRIKGKGMKRATGLWWIQLALNFCWSIVFFYLQNPWWGLVVILLLDGTVIAFLESVRRKDKWAAACFLPYLVWLLLASYLNLYVCLNN